MSQTTVCTKDWIGFFEHFEIVVFIFHVHQSSAIPGIIMAISRLQIAVRGAGGTVTVCVASALVFLVVLTLSKVTRFTEFTIPNRID